MPKVDFYERTRTRGAIAPFFWMVRIPFQIFFHLYLRFSRIGRHNIPKKGGAIIAANHRSFLDPWIIGTMANRPIYYVAKKELFGYPVISRLLSWLGAFPVARGEGDTAMIDLAKHLIARGELLLIFPEGHRIRPGGLGRARRGVGRLALETGAPVVPVALYGTEKVRKGWQIRPHKVKCRAGEPLQFPQVEQASPQLATSVTNRVWASIELQWEWLGGTPSTRSEPVEPALASAT